MPIVGDMENSEARMDLRELRNNRGWTLTTLAREAGFGNQSSITKIESGQVWPRLDNARTLAAALGVTLDDLFSAIARSHERARANEGARST